MKIPSAERSTFDLAKILIPDAIPKAALPIKEAWDQHQH